MATAVFGKGTKLQRNTGSGSAYQDIANVTSLSGPSATTDQVDITSHNSTSSFRETMGGMVDGGEVNASVNYDPATGSSDDADGLATSANHNRLMADMEAGTEHTWRVVFPVSSGADFVQFPGKVASVSMSSPLDGALTMDFTVKITGEITWVV